VKATQIALAALSFRAGGHRRGAESPKSAHRHLGFRRRPGESTGREDIFPVRRNA